MTPGIRHACQALLMATMALWAPFAYSADACSAVLPTTVAAHDPDARLYFLGGRVSGAPSSQMVARAKAIDLSLLPPSCSTASCSVSGQPAVRATLPAFQITAVSTSLSVGWFGNNTYSGSTRDFGSVSVGLYGTLALTPQNQNWRIRNLSLSTGSTLTLPPGDYWVENLSYGGGTIKVSGSGTARIFFKNHASFPANAAINPGSDNAYSASEKLLLVGWGNIEFESYSDVAASVYAAGSVNLDTFAYVRGNVAGASVTLDLWSEVASISDNQRANTNYGAFCSQVGDMDGDGIPDSTDPDRDGDGFSNVDEVAAGTSPDNPADYPDVIPPSLTTSLLDGFAQEPEGLTVAGTVSDSGGQHQGVASVRVRNVTTDSWTDATLSGNQYTAISRLIFGENVLNIVARDTAGNETLLARTVSRVDNTAPVIVLDGPASVAVEATVFNLTGNASDGANGSGIVTLYATSDRQGSTQYSLAQPAFAVSIPLAYGVNELVVHAADAAGRTSTATRTVTRVETVAPVLTLANPPTQVLRAASVTVAGTAVDNAGGSGVTQVTLSSNRAGVAPVTVVPGSGGAFSAAMPLLVGVNQITVRAQDAFNNAAVSTIQVTRPDLDNDGIPDDIDPDRDGDGFSNVDEVAAGTNPDNAADFPDTVAPVLTTTLADNTTVAVRTLAVSGTVTDAGGPHAAVASVTVRNAATGATVNATITGNAFAGDVVLVFGSNALTFTARDAKGNETVLTRMVVRADTLAPVVSLAGAGSEPIEAQQVVLTGTAVDGADGSGTVRVQADSDRQPGLFTGTLSGDAFSVTVPLHYGDNLIHVYVDDAQGNVGVATRTVRRIETVAPSLTLANPDQQTLLAGQVSVTGVALDNDGGSGVVDVTVSSDRGVAPQVWLPAVDGSISGSVALAAGTNLITVVARDAFDNRTTRVITVIRPDSDGDGTPDDSDDDRDGDGYSNTVEVNAGTNPDDPADYPDLVVPTLTTDVADNARVQVRQLAVTGDISDTGGPRAGINLVRIYNAATQGWTNAFVLNGHYSASVPLLFGDNVLTVLAADQSGNETVLVRRVVRVDEEPPVVTLAGGATAPDTDAPTFALTGTVTESADGAGIDRVYYLRDGDATQHAVVLTNDAFSLALPLAWGSNLFTVLAEDGAGNVGTATKAITRTEAIAPTLTLTTATPQTLAAASITVAGVAVDNPGGSGVTQVTVASNRGVATQTAVPDGQGGFSVEMALQVGTNTLTVTARDLIGNSVQATLVITRPDLDGDGTPDDIDDDRDGDGYSNADELARGTNPDAAGDFPDDVAPQITLDNPASQTIAAPQLLVSGTATDNRAVASVTIRSDRYGTAFAATVGEGGRFSATVPLALGANALTATVVDGWGNSASAAITAQRLSPPVFQGVTPASGSVSAQNRITVAGSIATDLDNDQLRLTFNGSQVIVGDGGSGGPHPFRIENVPLSEGNNRFVLAVNSPDGSDTQTLDITYLPDDAANLPPPALLLLAPVHGHWQSGDAVQVAGRVVSQGGRVTVRVNGAEVALPGDGTQGTFNTVRYFAGGAESLAISVTATDALGRSSTANATVFRDLSGPQITLDEALAPMPGENLRTESPFVLSGIVRDARLAGLLIDDAPATLEPTADPAEYRFTQTLPIHAGGRLLTLTASDTAGNVTQQAYHLSIDPSALIEPIVPLEGARFATEGSPVNVQVAARLTGEAAGATASAIVTAGGNTATFPLTLEGTLLSGDVLLPVQAGVVEQPATIRFEVRHPSVGLVAATQVGVTVNNVGAQPVAVVGVAPAGDGGPIKPGSIISIYFNKAIDPAKIAIEVRETLHGKTYMNLDAPGTDFTRMKGHQLVDVHRDREVVPGVVDPLPGSSTFVFVPSRFYGYGATVFADITYDGRVIGGSQWTVEPLPTQVSGNVVDQFGKAVQGVTVSLGNLSTSTNSDGAFSFGFDDASRKVLRGGEHALEVNPGMSVPGFGYRRQTVFLETGRFVELGAIALPMLNEASGFDSVRGSTVNQLARGALQIDLVGGTVRGPRGEEVLTVNVQALGATATGYPTIGVAPLGGLYVMQPGWVALTGEAQVSAALPPVLAALPEGAQLVFVGLDAEHQRIVPVALAEVSAGRAVQRGAWHGQWLDLVGISVLPDGAATLAQGYLEGSADWAALYAILTNP